MIAREPVAPDELMNNVRCCCYAQGKACARLRCGCSSKGLSCTQYCACEGADQCHNPLTIKDNDREDDTDSEEENGPIAEVEDFV